MTKEEILNKALKPLFYLIIAGMVMAGKAQSQTKKQNRDQHFKYVDTAFVWDSKIKVIIGKKSLTIDRNRNWQIDSVNVVYDRTKRNKVKYSRIDTIITNR